MTQELELGGEALREAEVAALEDEPRPVQVGDHGVAPLELRLDGELVERAQLGQLAVEDRPPAADEALAGATPDRLGVERGQLGRLVAVDRLPERELAAPARRALRALRRSSGAR